MTAGDPAIMNELGCLSKMLGHPLVDMEGGSTSIWKKANETYTLSLTRLKECECYIKESYIKTHIARYGSWPPCNITSIYAPRLLREAWLRNKDWEDPSLMRYGSMTIQDLTYVEILPNMHFNKLENAMPYLKDKAITLLKSNVVNKYLNQSDDVRATWKDTRLLIYFLTRRISQLDHVAYIDDYCASESLDELMNYLVIRIVPKEKEHKVDFRGFGCKLMRTDYGV